MPRARRSLAPHRNRPTQRPDSAPRAQEIRLPSIPPRRPRWTLAAAPDLHGQTWLITGAGRGLGLATARAARSLGARIILAMRDVDQGRELAAELGGGSFVVRLDLSDLASVRAAAEEVPEIDVPVNNAGASTLTRQETVDGFEWHLGVNALAPYLFTNLVLDRVRRRIVIVGSLSHRGARFDFDDPHMRTHPWNRTAAYSCSKLADLWWGLELSRRLRAAGSGVDVQLAHPGWADTALGNPVRSGLGSAVFGAVAARVANPPAVAALEIMYAATQPLPPCSYVGPDGLGELRGYPKIVGRWAPALDARLARRFWELAERETGEGQSVL